MKTKQRKQWSVCVDGNPVVIRKTRKAAQRSLGELRRGLPDLKGLTLESVLPVVYGDFILFERG